MQVIHEHGRYKIEVRSGLLSSVPVRVDASRPRLHKTSMFKLCGGSHFETWFTLASPDPTNRELADVMRNITIVELGRAEGPKRNAD
jgi:hypothetical protein